MVRIEHPARLDFEDARTYRLNDQTNKQAVK